MSLQIRWYPPSWVQLRTGESILYIDPAYMHGYFTDYPGHIAYLKGPDAIDGLPEALEAGEVILVTHHHKDHAKKVTIDRLRKQNTKIIAPKKCIEELGADIQVVKSGDEISQGGYSIRVVQAYNTAQGSSTRKIHKKNQGVGYLVSAAGKTIYHAGDSDFIPEMRELGRVDAAFLPIGGTYTMDIDEAVQAALAIHPTIVIPMHHLEADPRQFKQKFEALSADIRVVCPGTGEQIMLE